MKKLLLIILAILLVMTTLVSCTVAETPTGKPITKENIKIGAIFTGESSVASSESGAQSAQLDEARKTLGIADTQLLKKDNVTLESVEANVLSLIESGCRFIMVYSNEFDEKIESLAKTYPGIYFAIENGGVTNVANVKSYSARFYQAMYLSGICAGLKTQSDKIGFVAVLANSETQNEINAFAKGVYAVNKDARVVVDYIEDTYDNSFDSAKTLIEDGCDVIAYNCFSDGAADKAKMSEVFFCGYYKDMTDFSPSYNIANALMNTKTFIEGAVSSIFGGTWLTFDKTSLSIVNTGVDIKMNSNKIAWNVTKLIEAVKVKLVNGSVQIFDNVNISVTFGSEDEIPTVEVADELLVDNASNTVAIENAMSAEWLYRNVDVLVRAAQ